MQKFDVILTIQLFSELKFMYIELILKICIFATAEITCGHPVRLLKNIFVDVIIRSA